MSLNGLVVSARARRAHQEQRAHQVGMMNVALAFLWALRFTSFFYTHSLLRLLRVSNREKSDTEFCIGRRKKRSAKRFQFNSIVSFYFIYFVHNVRSCSRAFATIFATFGRLDYIKTSPAYFSLFFQSSSFTKNFDQLSVVISERATCTHTNETTLFTGHVFSTAYLLSVASRFAPFSCVALRKRASKQASNSQQAQLRATSFPNRA